MTTNIDAHIGRRMYARRRQLELTQTDLGAALKVTFQSVQKYECGAIKISAAGLYLAAKALRVEPAFFYEGWEG